MRFYLVIFANKTNILSAQHNKAKLLSSEFFFSKPIKLNFFLIQWVKSYNNFFDSTKNSFDGHYYVLESYTF